MINVISLKLHLKLELFLQRILRLFRIKVERINRIQRRLTKSRLRRERRRNR